MKVIKRDGSEQEFNITKIEIAIQKAIEAVHGHIVSHTTHAKNVANNVETNIIGKDNKIHIEDIQDLIEKELMICWPMVAKAFILYRNERAKLRESVPDPKAVSDYIHASKYAKYRPDLKRRETYAETVQRSIDMHIKKFPNLKRKIYFAFEFVLNKKVLPSMRSMQFGGAAIEQHNARMYNCSFTLIDRQRVFQEILYLLLSGCGVGFSIQKQHVAKLPIIGEPNKQRILFHKIEDSIVGWADAVGMLFTAYENNMYIEFCYEQIRPEGAILKTGGGRAPGHLPLKILLENIRKILNLSIGRHLKPIECYDIICFLAEAVLAGGVRRSSLIALFSKDDEEMINAKTSENFNYNDLNRQRAMTNNSVVLLREKTTKEEFLKIMDLNRKSFGEPGFMFTNNLDHGTNPCGEIGIDPTIEHFKNGILCKETGFGFCNLCEVNVAACKNDYKFYEACRAAAFIGTLQASYTSFPYLGKVTEEIVERDALLGVGLIGIMDNPKIGLNRVILTRGAEIIIEENQKIAELIKINSAKRCTTIKPSGTSSLELGCVGSGIHPHHAKRYFRRVTANVNEPTANYFYKINPHMVDKKSNGDLCITFPVQASKDAIILDDLIAMHFMDIIFEVYDSWIIQGTRDFSDLTEMITHNISATVVVRENEWEEVLNHAWNNKHRIRAMSFFPRSGDKEVPFIPREEVLKQDEAKWKFLIDNYKPIDYEKIIEEQDTTLHIEDGACSGGVCDIVHINSLTSADGSMFFTEKPDLKRFEVVKTLKLDKITVYQAAFIVNRPKAQP